MMDALNHSDGAEFPGRGQLFQLLSNETRCALLHLLAVRPHTIEELIQGTGRARSTVLRQLRELQHAGLVRQSAPPSPPRYAAISAVSCTRDQQGQSVLVIVLPSGGRIAVGGGVDQS